MVEPHEGFCFSSKDVVVSRKFQEEKFAALGLDHRIHGDFVDPSFYIGIGIQTGIEHGISAEGNVNMLSSIVQYRSVRLDQPLTARGEIRSVQPVPRGLSITTDVSFYDPQDNKMISAPRRSLKPENNGDQKGAGERPAPVIADVSQLEPLARYRLSPDQVVAYSNEGNAIHYNMEIANKAGFRAPIIGGGMGVHYLVAALIEAQSTETLALNIFFRRPVFWDDEFTVARQSDGGAIALVRDGKVLTEAEVISTADFPVE